MAYGTLNAGAITPGSGNTLTISETVSLTGNATLGGTANALGTVTSGNLSNTAISFPAGHVITSPTLVQTATAYSSTGADVTCSALTITINKKISSSKIIVMGSVNLHMYSYDAQDVSGELWFIRTTPSVSTVWGKQQNRLAVAGGSQAYFISEFVQPVLFMDTSTSTGNHIYTAHIDLTSTKLSFGMNESGGISFLTAYEIKT